MEKTFKINGMSCKHCKAMVENGLNALERVTSAVVNLDDNSVKVIMDDSLSIGTIKETIEGVGFDFIGEK